MDPINITGPNLKSDPETAWLEEVSFGGFRVWHIIAFCFGALMSIIIMVCCCIKFRIPRTKQEIEADYTRKQIIKRFREKIYQVNNSEMDNMDLPKALALIQTEFLTDENNSHEDEESYHGNDNNYLTGNGKIKDNRNNIDLMKNEIVKNKKTQTSNRLTKH